MDTSKTIDPQETPVTYWSYVEADEKTGGRTDILVTLTERQILDYYFPHWCKMMVESGRGDFVNEQDCISDWAVIHWAVKTDKHGQQL